MKQQRQRVLGNPVVVFYAPRHQRVRETNDGPEDHEVVVQTKTELTVTRYHNSVPDVGVIQHGHVRFPLVIVRADRPTRCTPNDARRLPSAEDGAAHRPDEISQRHFIFPI